MAAPVIHLGSWTVRRTGCAASYCAVSCTAKPTATKCEERWRRRPWISILSSQCPPRRAAATQTTSVPAACQTMPRVRSPVPSSLGSRDSTRGCGCKCDENPSADLWGWKKTPATDPWMEFCIRSRIGRVSNGFRMLAGLAIDIINIHISIN